MSKRFASIAIRTLSPAGPRGRLAVFCYHQVLDARDRYRVGEPDLEYFRRDLDIIGTAFNVLPLTEAARHLRAGTLPARAACITFDDGYENNHRLAAPALEAKGLPATFFIATDAVESGVMWNDLIIEALLRVEGEADISMLDGFSFEPADSEPARLQQLLGFLKYREPEPRLALAEEFYRRNAGDDPPRLMMRREHVADLGRRGFEIGGHTVHHPILKELPAETARKEIGDCCRWLEDVTGAAPRTFAYPNGIPGRDFDREHVAMVEALGIEAAVSTEWALARRGSDPLSIPRVGPWWRQGRSLAAGALRAYVRSYLS